MKNLTTVSTSSSQLVILNGYSYDGQISGDLDVYKYWVLSMWATPYNIFPGLSFISTVPSINFPYDTMQMFYVYKLGNYDNGYKLVSTTNIL